MQLSVAQGASGTVALSLAANAGFNGTVVFTCQDQPANTTCNFSPSTVTLTPNGSTTTTFTLATASSSAEVHQILTANKSGVILAGVFLFLLPACDRRRRLASLTVLFATCGLFILTGCSNKPDTISTPTGTALVTLFATATSNGVQVVQTVLATVTVTRK